MPKPTFFNLPPEKRLRIVEAAVEEFGSRPYRLATLDRIVEAAGVSKGSMYQYFDGKADLYGWLLTVHTAQRKLAALGVGSPSAPSGLWEALESMFLAGIRFALAEPGLTRLGARFYRDQHDEELRPIAEESRAMGDRFLRELVVAARDRGEVRPDVDVDLLAALIGHALGEGILEWLARGVGTDVPTMLEQTERLAALDEATLRRMVTDITRLLREGAGPKV